MKERSVCFADDTKKYDLYHTFEIIMPHIELSSDFGFCNMPRAITFVLFILLSLPVSAQSSPDLSRSPIPVSARFDIGSCIGQDFAVFYPVGWSESGRFAWIMREENPETNSFNFEYFIQDLVSGEILWRGNSMFSRKQLKNKEYSDTTGAAYLSKLEELNIVLASDDVRVKKFPMASGPDTLNMILNKQNGLYEDKTFLSKAEIILESRLHGNKAVYFRQNSKDSPTLQDLSVCAALRSPFEQRLALILCKRYLGFDEVCRVRFQVIGTHMSEGWK